MLARFRSVSSGRRWKDDRWWHWLCGHVGGEWKPNGRCTKWEEWVNPVCRFQWGILMFSFLFDFVREWRSLSMPVWSKLSGSPTSTGSRLKPSSISRASNISLPTCRYEKPSLPKAWGGDWSLLFTKSLQGTREYNHNPVNLGIF